MTRRAGPACAMLAAVLMAGCGGGRDGDAQRQWRDRCGDARLRIAALPVTGPRDRLALASGAASQELRSLAADLDGLGDPGDAVAAANLRNAVAAAAVGFADVQASISGIGTGGRARVVRDTTAAYARIDAAAATLGLPECGAGPLGRASFTSWATADESARSEPLPAVLARACTRIREAYGPTATAVDEGAALTQLRRSQDVLGDVRRDLAGRAEPAAVFVRTAAVAASSTLRAAERRVLGGAGPAPTTVEAFGAATPVLRAGFRRAGAPCSALG
ncbi:MAG: hypothetical protein IT200_16305 [Thermoleophilia bacterium]|nr:hypothetical protein [Thermoleophilia bacterium]